VLDALGISCAAIAVGLSEVTWPGRLELLDGRPKILLDAAHNPNGAQALAEFLKQQPSAPRVTLIYGSSREKAVDEVTGWLFPQVDHVILTRSRIKRALRPETLLRISGHHHDGIEIAATLQEAIDSARSSCAPNDWIVIAGSVFLVGEARELLGCE
jgi:dihydrofolate synthase/folylpolyglutamate synthase